MKNILKTYEKASRQALNYDKSEIFFSKNTGEDTQSRISSVLGVRRSLGTRKYLGLPSMVGRNKKKPSSVTSVIEFGKDSNHDVVKLYLKQVKMYY